MGNVCNKDKEEKDQEESQIQSSDLQKKPVSRQNSVTKKPNNVPNQQKNFSQFEQYQQIISTINEVLTRIPSQYWHEQEEKLTNFHQDILNYQNILKEQSSLKLTPRLFLEIKEADIYMDNVKDLKNGQIQFFLSTPQKQEYTSGSTQKQNPSQNQTGYKIKWNQFLETEIQNLQENIDKKNFHKGLDKQEINLKMYLEDSKNGNKQQQIGNSVSFSLFEMLDQKVHEKSVEIEKKQEGKIELQASLQFQVQLIHNFEQFFQYWNSELEARKEQINRILNDIKKHPENRQHRSNTSQHRQFNESDQTNNSLVNNSLINRSSLMTGGMPNRTSTIDDNSYYDTGFYAQ